MWRIGFNGRPMVVRTMWMIGKGDVGVKFWLQILGLCGKV